MTQQQIIQEFKTYPKSIKAVVIRELLQVFEKDLEEIEQDELSVEERLSIVNQLSGIGSVEGKTPPTDEEIREDYTNYLMEKYK
jgi:hypothetical protein